MANDYTHVLKTFCVSETAAHLWLFVAPCLNVHVLTYLLTYYVFLRVIVIIINVIIIAMLMVLLCKS